MKTGDLGIRILIAAGLGLCAASAIGQDSITPVKAGDSAYAYIPSGPVSWSEAQAQCEKMGGHLATIANAEENAAVVKLAAGKRTWLGASRENGGPWRWVDGSPWDFEDFDRTLPFDYVVIDDKSRRWASARHDPPLQVDGFVCEWKSAQAPPQIAMRQGSDSSDSPTFFGVPVEGVRPSPPSPSPGAQEKPAPAAADAQDSIKPVRAGDSAFAYIPSGPITWHRAKAECEKMGGHLATITTQVENDAVKKLTPEGRTWLGASRTDGKWDWVDGSEWDRTDFARRPTYNFLVMRSLETNGEMRWGTAKPNPDIPIKGFVCEWPANRAPAQITMRAAPDSTNSGGGATFFGIPLDSSGSPAPVSPPNMTPEVAGPDLSAFFIEIAADGDQTIGLLAKIDGKPVILTSAQKLSGASDIRLKARGGAIEPAGFGVSKSANLALIFVQPSVALGGEGFEIHGKSDPKIELASAVQLHDGENSARAGISWTDPAWLATDAEMNSGGLAAAIEPSTGKLIGIATAGVDRYGLPAAAEAKGETIVRIRANFAHDKLNWARWVKEREALDGLMATTAQFRLLLEQINGDRIIFINDFQAGENPLRDPLQEMQRTVNKVGLADADKMKARESFLRQAVSAVQRDINSLRLSHFSGAHHQSLFKAEVAERQRIKRELENFSSNKSAVHILEIRMRESE